MMDAAIPQKHSHDSSSSSIVRDVTRHVLINVSIVSILLLFTCLSPSTSMTGGEYYYRKYSFVHSSIMWSLAQMVKSLSTSTFADGALWAAADEWEASAWEGWERLRVVETSNTEQPDILDVPTIDLRSCNEGACSSPNSSRSKLTASEVKALAGDDFLSKPLLLRGLWSDKELADPRRRLSIRGMQNHAELANLSVPFYADATKSGYAALKPNGLAPLSEIVYNITELKGSQKIGSQLLVETHPSLIKEVAPNDIVTELFGSHFDISSIKGSGPFGFNIFPATTTVPVFLAGSQAASSRPDADATKTSRTDLHCEPIGNVAVQLHGSKVWTLVDPKQSTLLKPSVSRHGRAFYYSNMDPLDPNALAHVRHYKVITTAGDGLWVPPWMWHRVDYISNGDEAEPALAASLFHFRPLDFGANNPLFASLMIPNLLKEILGRNTE